MHICLAILALTWSLFGIACSSQNVDPSSNGDATTASDVVTDLAAAAACVPAGPVGLNVGDTAKNVMLKDCDGKDVSLYDLCGANAGYFYLFAAW